MSDATRDRLNDAIAAHLAGDATRGEVEMAALAHLDAEPPYEDLQAAYEADTSDQAAAAALNTHRMATRVVAGRPVTSTVGS